MSAPEQPWDGGLQTQFHSSRARRSNLKRFTLEKPFRKLRATRQKFVKPWLCLFRVRTASLGQLLHSEEVAIPPHSYSLFPWKAAGSRAAAALAPDLCSRDLGGEERSGAERGGGGGVAACSQHPAALRPCRSHPLCRAEQTSSTAGSPLPL